MIGVSNYSFEESRAFLLRSKKDSKASLSMLESMLASAFAGKPFLLCTTLAYLFSIRFLCCVLGAATSILSNPIWVVNVSSSVISSSNLALTKQLLLFSFRLDKQFELLSLQISPPPLPVQNQLQNENLTSFKPFSTSSERTVSQLSFTVLDLLWFWYQIPFYNSPWVCCDTWLIFFFFFWIAKTWFTLFL